MCDCSLLPELQTCIQLLTGYMSTGMWPRGTSSSCWILNIPFAGAALPPIFSISVTGTAKPETWESSLVLPPPLSPSVVSQSLQTDVNYNGDQVYPPSMATSAALFRPSSLICPTVTGCLVSCSQLSLLQIHPPLSPGYGARGLFKTKINNLLLGVPPHLRSCLCPLCLEWLSDHHFLPPPSFKTQFRRQLLRDAFADHHPIPFCFTPSQSIWGPLLFAPLTDTGYFYYWIYNSALLSRTPVCYFSSRVGALWNQGLLSLFERCILISSENMWGTKWMNKGFQQPATPSVSQQLYRALSHSVKLEPTLWPFPVH